MQVLKDVTLGADNTDLVMDLTGIDLSAWYLVRVVSLLQSNSGPWARSMMRFNGDTARNYVWFVKNNDGSSADSTNTATYAAGLEAAHGSGPDNNDAAFFGVNHVELVNPGASDIYKHYRVFGNMPLLSTGTALATIGTGFWKNVAPITNITQHANEAAWKVGSRAVLLGVVPNGSSTSVAPDGAPPLITGSDDFTRPDSSTLGLLWTPDVTHFGGRHQISGGTAKHDAVNGTSSDYFTGATFHGNQFSQAVIAGLPGSASWTGVTVRETAAGNGYLLIAFNNGGTHQDMNLYRMDAGAYTQIGTWTSAFNVGDSIRIEAVGTTIKAYKNGALLGTATDATYATGYPGIQTHAASGADPAALDSWQGGEL